MFLSGNFFFFATCQYCVSNLCVTQEKMATEERGEEEEERSARLVHANQCHQCDSSFKKPSDLSRHLRYLCNAVAMFLLLRSS